MDFCINFNTSLFLSNSLACRKSVHNSSAVSRVFTRNGFNARNAVVTPSPVICVNC